MTTKTTMATVPKGYEASSRSVADSQADAVARWLRMEWPRRGVSPYNPSEATIRGGENYACAQHADGSGVCMHYRTIENVRTRSGLLIHSSQCWAGGRARCEGIPREVEVDSVKHQVTSLVLPLTLLNSLQGADVYGLARVQVEETPFVSDASPYAGESKEAFEARVAEYRRNHEERVQMRPRAALLTYDDGKKVYVGHDEGTPFAFVLSAAEAKRIHSPEEAILLLKPRAVKRAEAAGKRVRRQGEWFFVAMPKDFEPKHAVKARMSVERAGWSGRTNASFGWSPMGNHGASYFAFADTPRTIVRRLNARHEAVLRLRAQERVAGVEAERASYPERVAEFEKARDGWHSREVQDHEARVAEGRAGDAPAPREAFVDWPWHLADDRKPKLPDATSFEAEFEKLRLKPEALKNIEAAFARGEDVFGRWGGFDTLQREALFEVTRVFVKGVVRHRNGREHAPLRLVEDGSTSIAFANTVWWEAFTHGRVVVSGGGRNRRAGRD